MAGSMGGGWLNGWIDRRVDGWMALVGGWIDSIDVVMCSDVCVCVCHLIAFFSKGKYWVAGFQGSVPAPPKGCSPCLVTRLHSSYHYLSKGGHLAATVVCGAWRYYHSLGKHRKPTCPHVSKEMEKII